MDFSFNEASFQLEQFTRLLTEAVVGIKEGPAASADDAQNTSEARLQTLGRFIVGFGTEEDPHTREYSFDFCGKPIDYDVHGKPVAIIPIAKSGYSLGSLQWDFGQQTALSDPFIQSFIDWHAHHPEAPNMVSNKEFAVHALQSDGPTLQANPARGLNRQDVAALTYYVRSDEGSDWVNTNIDKVLIGSDAQQEVKVGHENYGYSCVGAARLVEATEAFSAFASKRRWDMTDLIFSIAMKSSNQHGRRGFTQTFLPFLQVFRTSNEIETFYAQKKGGGDGIKAVTTDNAAWVRFEKLYPSTFLDQVKQAMKDHPLDNPYPVSKTNGWYVLAKQVFEDPDTFEPFLKAISKNIDFIVAGYFDAQGAVGRKKSGRFRQGMLRLNGTLFVWDAPGNAFKFANQDWAPIDITQININDSAAGA